MSCGQRKKKSHMVSTKTVRRGETERRRGGRGRGRGPQGRQAGIGSGSSRGMGIARQMPHVLVFVELEILGCDGALGAAGDESVEDLRVGL